MINNVIKLKAITYVAVLFLSTTVFVNPGYCNTISKVAVCPLEMNSTQDLSFLQKGLFSMLSSRLADPGKVKVLEREIIDNALSRAQSSPVTKGALNESKAKVIGTDLDVDYVLFGSLTMFGNSVSLDISMVDIKANKPALTFSRQAKEQGAVITELDKIAGQINTKVFARYPEPVAEPFVRQNYAPVRQKTGVFENFQTIFATNGVINGIAINDFDNDKQNELVAVFDHEIQILEYSSNSRLKLVKKIKDADYMQIIGVDSADINQNGYPEIFITRFNPGNGDVKSFIIEFNGQDYIRHKNILPWYLKIVKDRNGRNILYGQEKGAHGPYSAKRIFEIEFINNSWVAGQKLSVPPGFSILSMVRDFSDENNETRIIFTKKDGRLAIVNENRGVSWESDYGFGGSKLYYDFTSTDIVLKEAIQDDTWEKRVYFHPNNLLYDFNFSGKPSLVVIKNKNSSGDIFQQVKNYKNGSIEILSLNDMGLLESSHRKLLPGQVTCMVIADIDNDSGNEIIAAFVQKRNNFSIDKSKTMIVLSKIMQP